jgi:preprotein translocase subunit SecA
LIKIVHYEKEKREDKEMGLLQDWREYAYGVEIDSPAGKAIWDKYFKEEKAVYEELLAEPSNVVSGTVKELAEKYNMELKYMVGFLDGINESLKEANPIEEMTEDTVVSLDIDLEKLYYNMVEAKADWLYELPAWDNLLTAERRKELYREQKKSGTIVKGKKIGRNDPCPCGSGKKYKKCCGANA